MFCKSDLKGKNRLFNEEDNRSGMQNHPWHVLLNKVFYSSICLHLDATMFALVQKYFLVLKKNALFQ